jgi:hypothetical protein
METSDDEQQLAVDSYLQRFPNATADEIAHFLRVFISEFAEGEGALPLAMLNLLRKGKINVSITEDEQHLLWRADGY